MARLREDAVIAARKPSGWAATIAFHAAWNAAGGLRGIPAMLTIAGPDLRPTPPFLGVWKAAFPTIPAPRVNEPIITRSGVGTDNLLDAFRKIGA